MDVDLVLEGGGVKGIALVGAISVLAERGYEFQRIAGTSSGAIVGSLIAAGMTAGQLQATMRAIDYPKFRDPTGFDVLGLPGQALSVLFECGIYKGEYLHQWMAEQLERRGIRTFADLRLHDPDSGLPPDLRYRLVVIASDISYGRLRRLPWDYAALGHDGDRMRVADAVRASASIPFYYEPVRLRAPGRDSPVWLVDGGLLSGFPVEVFDRRDGRRPRWPTFGIKLSARPVALQESARPVSGPLSMAEAMLATMTEFYDHMHLDDPSALVRTMFVDTFGVRATDFDIDVATRRKLYESGRSAAIRFLDGGDGRPAWDFDRYVATYRSGSSRSRR